MAATLKTWGYTGGRYTPKNFQGVPYIAPKATSSSSGSLLDGYKKAQDEAKKANEERYAEILKGYEDMYSKSLSVLDNYGTQAIADIAEKYKSVEGAGMQDLASSGLYNSTIRPSVRSSVAKEQLGAQTRLGEEIALQKAQLGAQLQQAKLGFQERREDTYPDSALLANLMKSYGTSGAGSSSGGYGSGIDFSKYNIPNYYSEKQKKPATTYDTSFSGGYLGKNKDGYPNKKTEQLKTGKVYSPYKKGQSYQAKTITAVDNSGKEYQIADVIAIAYLEDGTAKIKTGNGEIITIPAKNIKKSL
ncbi:MAG: hypothetical protein PHH82_04600 [Candidatus ainarchaeum sp.]|nr:hypothetical protein [Candidatus ainarchaeum sp.]